MAYCRYHFDQPAVALCVRCRAMICAECTTRLHGINYCHECLQRMAARPARPRRRTPLVDRIIGVLAAWLVLALLLALVQGSLAP